MLILPKKSETDIEYSESDEDHTLEYYSGEDCIILQVYKEAPAFFCLWSPIDGPYTAFHRIMPLGLVPRENAAGVVESKGIAHEMNNRKEAFNKVLELGLENIEYFRLGPTDDCFVIQPSPVGEKFCCGMGGGLDQIRRLGTALTLTAPRVIIAQYHAMYSRLIGSCRNIEVIER